MTIPSPEGNSLSQQESKRNELENEKIEKAIVYLKNQTSVDFNPTDFKVEGLGHWTGGDREFGAHQGLIAFNGHILGRQYSQGGVYLADTRANREALETAGYTFVSGLGVPQPNSDAVHAPNGMLRKGVEGLVDLAHGDQKQAQLDSARKDANYMQPDAFKDRYGVTKEEFETDETKVLL